MPKAAPLHAVAAPGAGEEFGFAPARRAFWTAFGDPGTGNDMPHDQKANILLVDDRPENLLTLEAVLADLGQNLVKAGSGKEALKHLLEMEFAVILLDVQMPEMDGFQTAALIRSRPRSRHTPLIFLTAINKSKSHVFQGYSMGAVNYVFKPFVPEVLRSKVATFVELAKQQEELQGEIAHRKQAEEEVRSLNQELERRVSQRTGELARTNRKLEAEIAERRQLEAVLQERAEELAAAGRRKDEFLAMLAHELRNPLAPIQNAALLQRLCGDNVDVLQRQREVIERQVQHLARLVDDLLDVSRITRGMIELRKEPVECAGPSNRLSRPRGRSSRSTGTSCGSPCRRSPFHWTQTRRGCSRSWSICSTTPPSTWSAAGRSG